MILLAGVEPAFAGHSAPISVGLHRQTESGPVLFAVLFKEQKNASSLSHLFGLSTSSLSHWERARERGIVDALPVPTHDVFG